MVLCFGNKPCHYTDCCHYTEDLPDYKNTKCEECVYCYMNKPDGLIKQFMKWLGKNRNECKDRFKPVGRCQRELF